MSIGKEPRNARPAKIPAFILLVFNILAIINKQYGRYKTIAVINPGVYDRSTILPVICNKALANIKKLSHRTTNETEIKEGAKNSVNTTNSVITNAEIFTFQNSSVVISAVTCELNQETNPGASSKK